MAAQIEMTTKEFKSLIEIKNLIGLLLQTQAIPMGDEFIKSIKQNQEATGFDTFKDDEIARMIQNNPKK